MKIKTIRVCAAKGCSNEFRLFKSTDKFCCSACFYASQKSTIKKQKPINQISKKRKQESYIYKRKRLNFLSLPENKLCPVALEIFHKEIPATEIHHKKGRKGKLLNYVPHWLAVCREGHIWIHNNPEKAYKLNFLLHSASK